MVPTWMIFFAAAVVVFVIAYVLTIRNPGKVESGADLRKLNKNPQFHLGAKTRQIERQTEHFQAQANKVAMVDALENTGIRLREAEDLRRSTHDVLMAQNEANLHLLSRATAADMDIPSLNTVSIAREQARIDVDKTLTLKQIELAARAKQIQQDIHGALTVAVADKHKLLHIQDEVLKLIERSHAIKIGHETDEVKTAKLEILEEVITGLRRELRGLLQGNKQDGPKDGN